MQRQARQMLQYSFCAKSLFGHRIRGSLPEFPVYSFDRLQLGLQSANQLGNEVTGSGMHRNTFKCRRQLIFRRRVGQRT
jgi:hypothetical protein